MFPFHFEISPIPLILIEVFFPAYTEYTLSQETSPWRIFTVLSSYKSESRENIRAFVENVSVRRIDGKADAMGILLAFDFEIRAIPLILFLS